MSHNIRYERGFTFDEHGTFLAGMQCEHTGAICVCQGMAPSDDVLAHPVCTYVCVCVRVCVRVRVCV